MRKAVENQISFGSVDISQIRIDPKSRDEIDKALRGLQFIYTNLELRSEIFKILEENIQPQVSKKTGRPGMDLWKILVLGVIRQVCSWDYDKLHHAANNDLIIREFLGHERIEWENRYYYEIQTLKDNISLLSPEVLKRINEIVVKATHNVLGGKKKEELHTNVDSFVVKTDIHYPTDISLLYDSMRKAIELTADICESYKIKGWRQSRHLINTLKTSVRGIQNSKRSGKSHSEEKTKKLHEEYITRSDKILKRVEESITEIQKKSQDYISLIAFLEEIDKYKRYADKHIDLIYRRVMQGEEIQHSEKIFSIFEPHTRWISKGKMGVPVEFGLPLAILKDQHGLILEYEVMEHGVDVNVGIAIIARAKRKYTSIKSCSFDKGFWSRENRAAIGEIIEQPIMMKKGRLNKNEQAEHSTKEFKRLRKKHSSVESSINGLDHCGLEKCYDNGIMGFKRCVGLSILARNIHTLGNLIRAKEDKKIRRKKYKRTA
ncbi:MAG: transposase, family [Bacteroidota bacterium]|nr:transposase, family [Bacteroidota bacterium]